VPNILKSGSFILLEASGLVIGFISYSALIAQEDKTQPGLTQLQQKHFHFKNLPITNPPGYSEGEVYSFLHIKTSYAQKKKQGYLKVDVLCLTKE